jgi:hypothetical protein
MAPWLADRFALTVHDVRDARAGRNATLRLTCGGGHRSTAQFWSVAKNAKMRIVDRFALTADDARDLNCGALRDACRSGHLSTAAWLADRFALTADDARAEDNFAPEHACEGGHLLTAMWLTERFALTADDARAGDSRALQWAVNRNHPAVAQFLLAPKPAGMGATPPQALARERFQDATRRGLQELAQVLSTHAGIDNAWLDAQPQL